MSQNPISALAFASRSSKSPSLVGADSNGNVFAKPGPGTDYYVNATTGVDNQSGAWNSPIASLAEAQTLVQENNGDRVFLMGTIHETATVNWAVNGVDLIALLAPSNNGRSRISATGATAFSPLVNVTATGCNFINLGTFHGGFTGATGSQVCWADAAGRNHYKNCQMFGGGDATTAALAGMRSITVGGQGENEFEDCTFGLDTVTRATNANATMEFIGGAGRNKFLRSVFQSYVSAAGDCHILEAGSGSDRYNYFIDTILANAVDSGATTMSAAVLWNGGGSPAGGVIFDGGICVGATAVATTGPVYSNLAQANAAGMIGVKLT